jgi:hypothetical protein
MILTIPDGFTAIETSPDSGLNSLAVAPLSHMDVGVMNCIYNVLRRINPDNNKAIAAWVAKPPESALKLGEFETPKEFLIELAKGMAEGNLNRNQLPVVYVTREPSIAYADPSMTGHTEISEADIIEDAEGNAVARIMGSVANFSYTVNFVGWHDNDIAPLAMLFTMWLRDRKSSKSFPIKTMLMGCKIENAGKFSDGLMAAATNASLPYNQDRLRMLSVTVTVETDLLMAEVLNTQVVSYEFSTEVING